MYQTILFDLDGTLTDPGVGITNSVAYALEKYDIHIEDKTTLYPFIGPPLSDSFVKYYGFSQEQSTKAIEYYREYFRPKGIYENEIYDGVREMLSELKKAGKTIVLATSKPEEFAKEILKYFEIDKYFDFVAGASMDETRNKKVEVIAYALENCMTKELSKIVMIGDREYDILGAEQIGIDSIGVLYGYGTYEELKSAGATYIVGKMEELISLIMEENVR